MHPKRKHWLYGALAVALVAACVGVLRHQRQGEEGSFESAMAPPAQDEPGATEGSISARDEAQPATDEQRTDHEPGAVSRQPTQAAGDDRGAGTKHEEEAGSEVRADRRILTEDEFIEIAVKIRVWQQAVADTPEGERKLDELVRQLLDSEGLTPSDLQAFAESLEGGEKAVDRLGEKIDRRVAEIGETHFDVEPRPTKGTKILESDTEPGKDKP